MNAAHLAKVLGGEVIGRDRVLVPGPGHSPRDRSLSILLSESAVDGFVCESFAGDSWKDCRDHVRAALRISGEQTSHSSPRHKHVAPAIAGHDRSDKAAWLWSRRKPVERSAAEIYLRTCRGYSGPIPSSIAFLPPSKPDHHPAMIARFGFPGSPVRGVHLTLVRPDGSGKADIVEPKIMVGECKGSPIVLAPPNDLLGLAVPEGIEDGLSVHQATGLGVWAAGSAGFMPALGDTVPDYIEAVSIYQHPDDAGRRGARGLADRLSRRKHAAEVTILDLGGVG